MYLSLHEIYLGLRHYNSAQKTIKSRFNFKNLLCVCHLTTSKEVSLTFCVFESISAIAGYINIAHNNISENNYQLHPEIDYIFVDVCALWSYST